jgi:VCBS repeat-containing protein
MKAQEKRTTKARARVIMILVITMSFVTAAQAGSLIIDEYGKLPLSFVPNAGQTDSDVRFTVRSFGGTLFFTPQEVVVSLPRADPDPPCVLRIQFSGVSPDAEISGGQGLPGRFNYLTGNEPARWRTDISSYSEIFYTGIYPGTDLRYEGREGHLKSTFTVFPGADPSQIRWCYDGAEDVGIDSETGDLLIEAGGRILREKAPVAWQVIDGENVPVGVRFLLGDGGIGFDTDAYNPAYPLVIDPVTLVYSTFLGGSGMDMEATCSIALDSSGNAYITGETNSADFPLLNEFDTRSGPGDIFVTKLNAAGDALIYSTYLGGSNREGGNSIAVDAAGSAYLTGHTNSLDFPCVNAFQNAYAGGTWDGFVTKLNPAGSGLIYSTYLGGTGFDIAYGIDLDSSGNAYLTGYTESSNFPLQNPFDSTLGSSDAFVTKLNAAGDGIIYSTYLGGGQYERGHGITTDSGGNAYICGITQSSDFPLQNAFQNTLGGSQDAFITKLNAAGDALIFSTYLGGTNDDNSKGISLDNGGSVYVSGSTYSANFPTLNAFDNTLGGSRDAFIAKLNASGGTLIYSTYLGGGGEDGGFGIAADSGGNVYLTGYSQSADFPVVNAFQNSLDGFRDAFALKLDAAGNALLYSTYLGGGGNDFGREIKIDSGGCAYVTGEVVSTDFPTLNAFQSTYGGGSNDVFVSKISALTTPTTTTITTTTTTSIPVNKPPTSSGIANIAVSEDSPDTVISLYASFNDAESGAAGLTYAIHSNTNPGLFTSAATSGGTLTLNYAPDAYGTASITIIATDPGGLSVTAAFTVAVNPVNDVPGFTKGADQNVSEDSGDQIISGWATEISAGPANEAGQSLSFHVSNDNNALFSVQPNLDTSGTLTYTPSPNANGSASVTVILQDNDGGTDTSASQIFIITVTPVNDAPLAADDTDIFTDEDTVLNMPAEIGVLANDSDPDTDDILSVTASEDISMSGAAIKISSDGSYTYDPRGATDLQALGSGDMLTDTFTYTVSDTGGESDIATVNITVSGINDAPVLDSKSDDMILEAIYEDVSDADNPGTLIADIISSSEIEDPITDPDADAAEGIAVIGADTENGIWQYAPDSEGDFIDFPENLDEEKAVLLNDTARIRFIPDLNFNGTAEITFRAWDQTEGINGDTNTDTTINGDTTAFSIVTQTALIIVNPVNDAPQFSTAPVPQATEDALYTYLVTSDDIDMGDTRTISALTLPDWLVLTDNLDGTAALSGIPSNSEIGDHGITLQVTDAEGATDTHSFIISVRNINDAPELNTGDFMILSPVNEDTDDDDNPGTPVSEILSGMGGDADMITDIDPEAAEGIAVTAVNNSGGVWQYDPDGTGSFVPFSQDISEHKAVLLNDTAAIRFIPDPDFNGNADITVRAWDCTCGESGDTDADAASGGDTSAFSTQSGKVYAIVRAVNDAPIAEDDRYETAEDRVLTIPAPGILANDSDIDSSTLRAVKISDPANGTLILNHDGSFTYTPAPDFNGEASFTYKVSDGGLDSGTAQVRITVTPVGDPPVATDDSYQTDEDQPLEIPSEDILANDTDIENDPLTVKIVSHPERGTLIQNDDGIFVYTPDPDYHGTDSFAYSAYDGTDYSQTAAVIITVSSANDAPVAVRDTYSTDEDQSLNIPARNGILTNDSDTDGEPLTAIIVNETSHGSLKAGTDGSFEYRPEPHFNGEDSFTYKVSDGELDSQEVTVTIAVRAVNDPPIAKDDAYRTDEEQPLKITEPGILKNDRDVEGDRLKALKLSNPEHGILELEKDGGFVYTPDENFNGKDRFSYRVKDGTDRSEPAVVKITVNPVNDPPAANDDAYTVNEDDILTVSGAGVLTNDSDADGDPLKAVKTGDPAGGSLTLNADGSFTYKPDADFTGTDSFAYNVSDGKAESESAAVKITIVPVNDPPVAEHDFYTTDEDTPLIIPAPGVLANDSDTEDSTLNALQISSPVSGSAVLNPDGSFIYTPNPDFSGQDSFSYKVSDGTEESASVTVLITVNPVNDLPDAADDSFTTEENMPLTVESAGVLANDSDPEGSPLKAVKISEPEHGSLILNQDGSFIYTPEIGFSGTDSFTYKAADGTDESESADVTITIYAPNHAPVLDNSGNMTLFAIDEDIPDDMNTGIRIYEIINSSEVYDPITDPDVWAYEGIAVIAVNNENGVWQYAENRTEIVFADFPEDIAEDKAVLLDDESFIRFIPYSDYNGRVTPGITFRAWDRTFGDSGDTDADTTFNGGHTSFSTDIETAEITVLPVNDPPYFTSTPVTSGASDEFYLYEIAAEDIDADDILVIISPELPFWLTLTDNGDGTAALSGIPGNTETETYRITLQVQDAAGAADTQSFMISLPFTAEPQPPISEPDSPLPDTIPENKSPLSDAGPDQTVTEDAAVVLNGSGSSDPDDGIAAFQWEQTDGIPVILRNDTEVRAAFTAPDVGPEGSSLKFRLTVTDHGGLQSEDICIVNVTWDNEPPVADAGDDQTVYEGETVILDGSGSADPDDGIASFQWKQTDGMIVILSDETASQPDFTAPDPGYEGISLEFQLTVSDHGGLQSQDICTVNIIRNNEPPVADAGDDQTADGGESVILDGSGSYDPEGGVLIYSWHQTAGIPVTLSDPAAKQPVFTAPESENETVLTFHLTVEDDGGLQDTAEVRITVRKTETEPVIPSDEKQEDEPEDEASCLDCSCSGHTCFIGAAGSGMSSGMIFVAFAACLGLALLLGKIGRYQAKM